MTRQIPIEDAMVASILPDNNYGNYLYATAGKNYQDEEWHKYEIYVKFNLKKAEIFNYTTLKLHFKMRPEVLGEGEDSILIIYDNDGVDWSEDTITWNNKPDGSDLKLIHITIGEGNVVDFDLLPFTGTLAADIMDDTIFFRLRINTDGREFRVNTRDAGLAIDETIYLETVLPTPPLPTDGFFYNIGAAFEAYGDTWLVGDLAVTVAGYFYSADEWLDSLSIMVSDFLTWTDIDTKILDTYSLLSHTWSDVTALIPSWSDLVPEGFPSSLSDLETLITTTISSAWALFGDTASEIVIKGKTTILGWFPYDISDAQSLLTWIGIEAGDVITTILDTPADMFAWIKGEIDVAYDIVSHTWSEVEALIPSWSDLVPEGFPASFSDLTALITETIWGTFTSLDNWFDAQKEKTLNWVVDSFEWILDKVFKE